MSLGIVNYPISSINFRGNFVARPPIATHSGAQALGSYFSEDMGSFSRPIQMVFTGPITFIGLYVGREAPTSYSTGSIYAVLTAFGTDETGNPGILRQSWVTLPGYATPINRCLQVSAPPGTVFSHASVDFTDGEGRSVYDRRWIDDVTLDYASGPYHDNPPTVTIVSPTEKGIVYSDSVALDVTPADDYGISNLTYRINKSFESLFLYDKFFN